MLAGLFQKVVQRMIQIDTAGLNPDTIRVSAQQPPQGFLAKLGVQIP